MKEIKKQLFVQGMRDGIPIGLGYFAVSFTLGIAAKNAGMKTVCVPAKNEKDLHEISEEIKKGLEIVLVEKLDQVLEVALVK